MSQDQAPASRRLPPRTILRTRLSGPAHHERIVVIIAPAGYGKTTLARQWAAHPQLGSRAIWVGMDAAWRDSVYFERNLLAALGQANEPVSNGPFSPTTTESSLLTLLTAMGQHKQALTLFIDDAHELRHAPGQTTLNRLMESSPAHIRWVISSRDAIGLDLASLTARGQVRWLTHHDLQFNAQEVSDLVRHAWPISTEDEIDQILAMTEGWPTLVQLVLASSEGTAARSAIEADVLMDNFIHERFFKALASAQQEILFTMASAGEFTAQLLLALGISGAKQAISDGCNQGIVDRRGHLQGDSLYVLHPLLAEHALHGLTCSRTARELRLKAAHWWRARGDLNRAIRLALAGDDAMLASSFLDDCAIQLVMLEGRQETFLELLAQVESHGVPLAPILMSHATWCCIPIRCYSDAQAWLTRIEAALMPTSDPQALAILHTTILQKAALAGFRDDARQTEVHAREWLKLAGSEPTIFHAVAHGLLAFSEAYFGRYQSAIESVRITQQVFEATQSPYGLMWADTLAAITLLKAGRLRDALATTTMALTKHGADAAGGAVQRATLRAIQAFVLYERGQLDEALVCVEATLPLLPHQGAVDGMVAGYVAAARLQAARGDLSAALDAAAEGQRVGMTRGFLRLQLTMVAERALLLLRAGEHEAAAHIATEHGLLPDDAPSDLHRALAEPIWPRVALAKNQAEQALQWLEIGLARAEQGHQNHRQAEFLMLKALAYASMDRQTEAQATLLNSLRLASIHGYQRLYLDEGVALLTLLRATVEQAKSPTAAISYARATFDMQTLPQPAKPQASGGDEHQPTERERLILQLAQEGLSNVEVAARLVLTEGTVKWHLHNLYAKLGVRNRTGALKAAKARGWLDT
jgi:LuxR family maltose regulon positive regulatory protein